MSSRRSVIRSTSWTCFDVGAAGLPEPLALLERLDEGAELLDEVVLRRAHDRHLDAERLLGLADGILVERGDDRLTEGHPLDREDPVPVAEHLVDDDVRLLVALERVLVANAVDDVEVDRELLAGLDHAVGAFLLEVRRSVHDPHPLALAPVARGRRARGRSPAAAPRHRTG